LGADYVLAKQQVKRKAYLLTELRKLEAQIALQSSQQLLQPPETTKKKKGRFLLTPATQT